MIGLVKGFREHAPQPFFMLVEKLICAVPGDDHGGRHDRVPLRPESILRYVDRRLQALGVSYRVLRELRAGSLSIFQRGKDCCIYSEIYGFLSVLGLQFSQMLSLFWRRDINE